MCTSQTPLLSMLALTALLAAPLSVVRAAPAIRVARPEFAFGTRREGEVIEHRFTLRNPGTEPLRIPAIRTSCGCTIPGTTSLEIPAGGSHDLAVKLDLKGKTGEITQYVTLSTNDPEHPSFTLKLTGKSLAEIEIDPRTLNLGTVDPAAPEPGVITLTSTTGQPFRVTGVEANRGRVRTELDRTGDGRTARITVTPKELGQDGRFTDVVLIDTDHPEVKGKRVLVMWQISTGITVAPTRVNLVLTDQKQILNRYLMVRGYPGMEQPLEITEVTWPGHEEVEISFMDTRRFGWRIHLKNFTPTPDMDGGQILIRTNIDGFETLTVPVKVVEP